MDPEDYIFPMIGANGIAQPGEHASSDAIQSLIDAAVRGAGLPIIPGASYSTHCFRRGGAQYRFMYAPVGQRWTLARIRWWGGWAEGDQVSPQT